MPRANAAKFLEKIVGPVPVSTREFTYIIRLPDPTSPPVLFVETDSTLDGHAIASLFGKKAFHSANGKGGSFTAFGIELSGASSFRLFADNVVTRDAFLVAASNADKYIETMSVEA